MQHNSNNITFSGDRAWFAAIGVIGILVGLVSLSMIWTTRDVSQMGQAMAAAQNERLRDMSENQDREVQRLRDRLATVEAEFSELKAYKAGGFDICREQ